MPSPLFTDLLILFKFAAKNNSEFIYYGKYNKELPRPRSFSKNNQQLAAGDSSESSNGGKSFANVTKSAATKNVTTANAGCGSNAAPKGKKQAAKSQARNSGGDAPMPGENLLVRAQKSEKGPKAGNKEAEAGESEQKLMNRGVVSNFLSIYRLVFLE